MQGQISFGKSQTLMRDYTRKEEIKAVLLEICEEVARRARAHNKVGRTISLGIGYSKDELGGGFHRSKTIDLPTNITMDYRCCLMLFHKFYSGKIVRSISVTLSNIEDEVNQQLSLVEVDNEKRRKLGMDGIRSKYGSKAILRAVSYTPAGTALHRARLTGGHKSSQKVTKNIIVFCYHLVKKLTHINLNFYLLFSFAIGNANNFLITIIRAWLY